MITPKEQRHAKRDKRRRALPDTGAYVAALHVGATRAQAREAQAIHIDRAAHRPLAPWRAGWKAAPIPPAPKIEIRKIRPDARVYARAREAGQNHTAALHAALQTGVRL